MKNIFLILLSILGLELKAQSDINISNSPFWDTEPNLICSPTDSSILVCAWMSAGLGLITIKSRVSHNEGLTWGNTHLFAHHYINATSADVSMRYDANGILYLTLIDYKPTFDSGAVYMYKSIDDGVSWDNGVKVFDMNETADGAVDRPWFAIDAIGSSPTGIIYVTTKSPEAVVATNKHVWLKRSLDGGATFSNPIQIDNATYPAAGDKTMAVPVVEEGNWLYIVYLSYQTGTLQYPKLICALSTDSGNTFSYSEITQFTNAVTDTTLQVDWDITSQESSATNIYYTIQTSQSLDVEERTFDYVNAWPQIFSCPNSDWGAYLYDEDMIWSAYDGLFNQAAVWRDRRYTGSSAFEIFAAFSDNSGNGYYPERKLSSGSSPNQPISKGNDFLGCALNPNYLFAAWGDYRDGNWEIYFNRIPLNDFTKVNTPFANDISVSYSNHSLIISNNKNYSNIKVVDALGRLILSQSVSLQQNEIIKLKSDLPAGVYFAQLSDGTKSLTQKFVIPAE